MQRIKLLSGEKEVVIETENGLQKTFKVTQVNIQRLIDDLRANKDRIISEEGLVSQSREMVRIAEEDLSIQEK